jgi:hypothetical protein
VYHWFKPGHVMSCKIDYSSDDHAYGWNGHWTIPDPIWTIARGWRPYLLNRFGHSERMKQSKTLACRLSVSGNGMETP